MSESLVHARATSRAHAALSRRVLVVCLAALAATLSLLAAPPAADAVVRTAPSAMPSFDAQVNAIAYRGNRIYMGGAFTRVTAPGGAVVKRNGLAAVNAVTGRVLPWNPSVNGTVFALVAAKDGVFVGGSFTRIDGVKRRNLAKVKAGGTGNLLRGFRANTKGAVRAFTLSKNLVYLGGNFKSVRGEKRQRLAALQRKAPYRLAAWRPRAAGGTVRALQRTKWGIYVAGDFRTLNRQPGYARLVQVAATKKGKLVKRFNAPLDRRVFDIKVTKKRVYAGIGGRLGGSVGSYGRKAGGEKWSHTFDGDAQAISLFQKVLYVGGHFNRACRTNQVGNTQCPDAAPRRRFAALDLDGRLLGWSPTADSDMGAVVMRLVPRHGLAVGGDFNTVEGQPRRKFALFAS